jgi:hypothetical protein
MRPPIKNRVAPRVKGWERRRPFGVRQWAHPGRRGHSYRSQGRSYHVGGLASAEFGARLRGPRRGGDRLRFFLKACMRAGRADFPGAYGKWRSGVSSTRPLRTDARN